METLEYFAHKHRLNLEDPSPINIEPVSRLVMAQSFAELGFHTGAEIGVAAGDHSRLLLDTIPDLTLYCVDTWIPDRRYWAFRGSTLANWHKEAVDKLSPFPNCVIKKQTSLEAAQTIPDESLDFVYIDAAHDFRNISVDLWEWARKVRKGGVVYGHDYTLKLTPKYACHVKYVVDAYMLSFQIKPWFVLGANRNPKRGQAEDIPEWMYVK